MKVEVTTSEVRQELEASFGPNIIYNLDRIDMTLDEAELILKDDLTIRKMMSFKVNGKAFSSIGPAQIREAYETWVAENKVPESWSYRVVSIRDSDPEAGRVASRRIRRMLTDKGVSFEEVKERAESEQQIFGSTTLTVSDELANTPTDLSDAYKEALEELKPGEFSEPISQVSRKDSTTVYRIFYLASVQEETVPPLRDVETKIKNMLYSKAMEKEGLKYTSYLRNHFTVSDEPFKQLPKSFEPFALNPK
jgi:hypothetical protein